MAMPTSRIDIGKEVLQAPSPRQGGTRRRRTFFLALRGRRSKIFTKPTKETNALADIRPVMGRYAEPELRMTDLIQELHPEGESP